MKKKSVVVIVVLCCIALIGTVGVFAANLNIANTLYIIGLIEREHLDSASDSNVFVVTPDFVIYEYQIAMLEEPSRFLGASDARERAIGILMDREIMYTEALNRGFFVSSGEVMDYINFQIETMRLAENLEEFSYFFRGIGMSLEEYWESQYDVLKRELVIERFFLAKYETVAAANRSADQEDIVTMVQSYFREIINEYIEAHDLQWALTGIARSITLRPTEAVLGVGDRLTLAATVHPETNSVASWTSSTPGVATVDANGVVTAVSAGTATVTATTADGEEATSEILVLGGGAGELPGDVNGDGVVDFLDLLVLIYYLDNNGNISPDVTFVRENADLNGDGVIDDRDLEILMTFLDVLGDR